MQSSQLVAKTGLHMNFGFQLYISMIVFFSLQRNSVVTEGQNNLLQK